MNIASVKNKRFFLHFLMTKLINPVVTKLCVMWVCYTFFILRFLQKSIALDGTKIILNKFYERRNIFDTCKRKPECKLQTRVAHFLYIILFVWQIMRHNSLRRRHQQKWMTFILKWPSYITMWWWYLFNVILVDSEFDGC